MYPSILLLIMCSILKCSLSEQNEECVLWNTITTQNAWDNVLHKKIVRNHILKEPPRNQTCVPVEIHIQLKDYAIDEYEEKFVAGVWTVMKWKDERFTWKPEDYGGVEDIIVHSSDIWTPSFKLMNCIDADFFYTVEYGECFVQHNGDTTFVIQTVYESFCSPKLSNWPYDVQQCTMEFGNGDRFDISEYSFTGDAVANLFPGGYGKGWNITANSHRNYSDSDIKLSVTLTMERQAYGLVVVLVVPCLIVCALTCTTLLLNVQTYLRLGLCCFSLLSHFVLLIGVSMYIPKHSSDTPVILLFIRGSIILTAICVLLAFTLRKIVRRKTEPSEWVTFVCSKVFDSYVQHFVIPRWNFDLVIKHRNVRNSEIWNNFANILNSVCIVIVVIVYFGMFSAYMPKNHQTRTP